MASHERDGRQWKIDNCRKHWKEAVGICKGVSFAFIQIKPSAKELGIVASTFKSKVSHKEFDIVPLNTALLNVY